MTEHYPVPVPVTVIDMDTAIVTQEIQLRCGRDDAWQHDYGHAE